MKIILPGEYKFLYETHMHTNTGSACGHNTGSEMAAACKSFGYSGAFITDHNWGGNTCVSRELPWEQWITLYARGYYDAKKYGSKHDFDVFFGMETGFDGTEFLLLGLEFEWFLNTPELRSADIENQYKLVHAGGGLVSQAHPYRVEPYIPEVRNFPQFVDAFETSNATHSSPLSVSHNNPDWDDLARELAKRENKLVTAGSDTHSTRLFGGGMAFKRRIRTSKEFADAIFGGEDYILSDGLYWRDKSGNILEGVSIV